MDTTKRELLLHAENVESFVNDFENFIDKVIYFYLSQSCIIVGYIHGGITDNGILEAKLEQHLIDFKQLCEKLSKFKLLEKFIFLPCEDLDANQVTFDEKIEFSFNYESDKTFMNKNELESYHDMYQGIGKPIIYIEKIIQYGTDTEVINLKKEIIEIKEKLQNNNLDINDLQTQLESIEEKVKTFEIEDYYDILNTYSQNVKIQNNILVETYYHKYVMKKQDTFEHNDIKNNTIDCAICLEDFEKGKSVTKLKCGHVFCTKCIKKWLEVTVTCPYCKQNPEFSPE